MIVLKAGGDGVVRLSAVRGANCSHSADWQHLENTRHIGDLSDGTVNPIERPRHGIESCFKVVQLLMGSVIVVETTAIIQTATTTPTSS